MSGQRKEKRSFQAGIVNEVNADLDAGIGKNGIFGPIPIRRKSDHYDVVLVDELCGFILKMDWNELVRLIQNIDDVFAAFMVGCKGA
jgi:hypothetical protein